MTMAPRLRTFALTLHVATSVGWLGAVVTSLVLGLVGLTSPDLQVVRAAYLMLEVTGWFVLVPLGLASLATGLVMSLGTRWGLIRHYWVLAKLLITILAILVLALYTQTLDYLADRAGDTSLSIDELQDPSPAIHAGAALLALLVTTTLSVYKPRGLTRYGWRRSQVQRVLPRP